MGRPELAIENYSKAIEMSPNYADPHYFRGETWAKIGNRARANADLARARSLGFSE